MKRFKALVGRWQLRKLKKQMQSHEHSFPTDLLSPKRILVCLPGTLRELTLVKQFLPMVSSLYRSATITLLTIPGVKVHDIYPRRGYQILTPTTDQLSWSGVPSKSYLTSLREAKFDMVIDLNLERSFFTSAVLLNFPEAIRVGRGNHLGNPYYNLEIKTKYLRDERNIYRSLLETLGTLVKAENDNPAVDAGA